MDREQNMQSLMLRLARQFRNPFGSYNTGKSLMGSVFLRYLLGLAKEASTVADMKALMELQNALFHGKPSAEQIKNALAAAERIKSLEEGTLSMHTSFFDFVYGPDSGNNSKLIAEMQIPETKEELQEFFSALIDYMAMTSGRYGSNSSSPEAISRISAAYLKPEEQDVYMDAFSGVASSSFYFGKVKKYLGYEQDSDTAMLSKIVLLIQGKTPFSILEEDFFQTRHLEQADKVLCDGPFNSRLETPVKAIEDGEEKEISDTEAAKLFLSRVLLKEKGKALVVTTGHALFGTMKSMEQERAVLSKEGLKGIVYLPAGVSKAISIPLTLILIEEGYAGPVLLINATKTGIRKTGSGGQIRGVSPDGMSRIVQAVEKFDGKQDFTKFIDREKLFISANETNWTMARFFQEEIAIKTRSLEEIQSDINRTLDRIQKFRK